MTVLHFDSRLFAERTECRFDLCGDHIGNAGVPSEDGAARRIPYKDCAPHRLLTVACLFNNAAANTGLDKAGRSISKIHRACIKRPPFAHAPEEKFECRLDFEVGDDGATDRRQFAHEYLEGMRSGLTKSLNTTSTVFNTRSNSAADGHETSVFPSSLTGLGKRCCLEGAENVSPEPFKIRSRSH